MSDKLLEVIEDLQSDENLNSLSEADISLGVILRILDALSWSTYNRREVSPEYSVENRWVDYALLIGNTPEVFIEVKKGGEPLERHQEQLLDYAFRQGVKVAILTNGATWWFYLPLRAVSWKQRKVATVELDKQDKGEIAQKLVNLLGKENVRSGKAVQNAEVLYKKRQSSATLPEAWNQLMSEPDDLLVELLAEKTGELCGHKPDKHEVEQFLLAHPPIIDYKSSATLPEAWNQLMSEPDDLLVELLVEKTGELCGHKPDKHEVEQFLLAHPPIIDYSGNVSAPVRKVQGPLPSQPSRWSGDKPVREVVLEAGQELTGGDINVEFAPQDVSKLISKKYPDFKVTNVGAELAAGCPNLPSHHHHSVKHKYYWWVKRGTYRLYDPERDKVET